jgi:hypothetical protein
MTDINVIWMNYHPTAPAKGYWCYGFLEEILANTKFERNQVYHGKKIEDVPEGEGAILVIPAEYNVDYVTLINRAIESLPWSIVILASDEQGLFPVELLAKPTALWVMTPHFEKHEYPDGTQFLGEYYPQDAREHLKQMFVYERTHKCSFSGQVTHERRQELAQAMNDYGYWINATPGFTQGLSRSDYYRLLADTETTPAPSGPVTLDSFRAFETLEAGGIPILDLKCPLEQDGVRYWNAVLGEGHPLPATADWNVGLRWARDHHNYWPLSSNLVYSWWQQHKRELRYRILSAIPGFDYGPITVLIPTSPIPDHPSTEIIDDTIASVRYHLPDADILILCDGVRSEQEHRREDYERYVQYLCWKANFEWEHVTPIVFAGHEHQANMTRVGLDFVRTPYILFVEHDTPLVTDEPIDWEGLKDVLTCGYSDVIRLHFEAGIHPEHEHLMLDHVTRRVRDVPLRRTAQWSQRPHLAVAEYYRRILEDHFPPTGRTMIEDKMHSVAQCDPQLHRISIYHPETGNIKRSLHSDGRKEDPKYEMVYE